MKIIIGKNSGFCYGVKRAVETAEKEANNSDKSIYCLGELIHNETVTEELKSKGIIFINDISEAKNKTIIRAHGVDKRIYEYAEKNKIELIDLTCPTVINIHNIVQQFNKEGYYIFVIGKKEHPEIIGTISFAGQNSCVISDTSEITQRIQSFLKTGIKRVLIISQTTFSLKKFDEITQKITNCLPSDTKIVVKNSICKATELRQIEAEDISKQVDLMIVIGGKNSSNTLKLYEICLNNCKNVIFIQDEKQIDIENVMKFEKIGIVAGASTPKKLIDKVVNLLRINEK